jgi:hypothetical protein
VHAVPRKAISDKATAASNCLFVRIFATLSLF